MPSASSKSEKLAPMEAIDPLKQAIVIIEHKIRNLEKRKVKLDSYKESIKSLTKEQVEAIAKYDEVVQQLELSKEYVKQFTGISIESDKNRKKQAKKDAQEKYTAEINKIKQVLQIQDVLQNMGTESVRQDFLAGKNGAIQLTEADLKALDDFYAEVIPKRISEDGKPLAYDHFQKSAEFFMAIVEGKAKEMAGLSGAKLRDLVTSIHSCGYFDKVPSFENANSTQVPNSENETPEEEEFHDNQEILSNVIVPTPNPLEGNLPSVQNAAPVQPMMPGGPVMPGSGVQPPMMQPHQQPIIPPTNIVPTPVSQVESSFFNAQGFKPPVPPNVPPNQNSRQINDVIQSVAGKFNFLQESELEITDMNTNIVSGNPVPAPQVPGAAPSTIPTQTFTNQNFNGQPATAPAYPPNYPPQPTAFPTFVPAFPAFVPPNPSQVQNPNVNANPGNPEPVAPVNNSVNPNNPASASNSNSSNKCNIPNPIPMASNRNPNVNFNQGQQQLSSSYANQPNTQTLSQTVVSQSFQHGNMPLGSVENTKIEVANRGESDMKEKQENEKQDWSQPERTNWADDFTETSEWNSPNPNQSDGASNINKFSTGRTNRNGSNGSRSTNGYQGNRNRTSRPGYWDSQNNQGGSSGNYYQNQNGYQSRNERNNEYLVGGKGADLRENSFRERGDYNNRDRDSYGGFKRNPSNRGPNMKGPMDRGDRQGQIPRNNNAGGPRPHRNLNRQPGGGGGGGGGVRSGPNFPRQQSNSVGPTAAK